ncbi:hypothetical protein T09_7177 [Trichinella sp. T9]|nr:hypothetical protein T09_7177 [Trichinella sp. T9]
MFLAIFCCVKGIITITKRAFNKMSCNIRMWL